MTNLQHVTKISKVISFIVTFVQATAVKDKKNIISNQTRANENLHPLLDTEGNITVAKVIMPSFLQSLTATGVELWAPRPQSWKTNGKQNEASIIQEEMVSDTLPRDWKGSTHGYCGGWQEKHFQLFAGSPGQLGMSQLTGDHPVWCPSTRRFGRRISGIAGLSACSWC